MLREGLGKRSRLAPVEPPNRYERRAAGELIHVDIKKLGRILVPGHALTGNRRQHAQRTRIGQPDGRSRGTAGWEFVHVAVDDYSRLAYAEVLGDERPPPQSASCAAPSRSSPATQSRCGAS